MSIEEEHGAGGGPHSGPSRAVFSTRRKASRRRRVITWLINQILLLGFLALLIRLWSQYQQDMQDQQSQPQPQRGMKEIELEVGRPPERAGSGEIADAVESGAGMASARMQAAVQAGEDDLKVIEGIGPKIEELLRAAGISSYEKLAESDVRRLAEILDQAGLRMVNPGTWPEQARLAAAGDMEGLEQLKGRLKAGRRV